MKKIICAILLGLLPGIVTANGHTNKKKPNIVFVMIDDLGAEQIASYGSESYKTPHIDKWARMPASSILSRRGRISATRTMEEKGVKKTGDDDNA